MSPFVKGAIVGIVVVFAWQHFMGGTGKSKVA
jgi:hypothetical protein